MSPADKTAAPEEAREQVSELTTGRLSLYLRCLTHLEASNRRTISSQELADRYHLNSAQIRKDLAHLGELGIRGVGYDIAALKRHLVQTLGIDRLRKIVIAGAGNLGMALADYRGLNESGFHIVALLDSDRSKSGTCSRSGIPVLDAAELSRVVREQQVEIGIIAVPAESAQAVYDSMVDAGISAVLNFAPARLRKREGVKLKSVDLRVNLESLSFHLKHSEESRTSS